MPDPRCVCACTLAPTAVDGGGSVAMGAGMGFLGGMMVGDMMADAGHHGGGGDYGGGGGDFAADM